MSAGKIARSKLPETPPNDVTAGIDCVGDDHAMSVDGRDREAARTVVEHCAAGLRQLIKFLVRHGADKDPTERPDGPVVDPLSEAEITVAVSISPSQVKGLEARINQQLGSQTDLHIFTFTSLPRSGCVRAARLLAGVTTLTLHPGEIRAVEFRWAYGKQLHGPSRHHALKRVIAATKTRAA